MSSVGGAISRLRMPSLATAYCPAGGNRLLLISAICLLAWLPSFGGPGLSDEGTAQLEAKEQRREGDVFYADGDVEIRYQGLRMRADHVEYNASTHDAIARGHVIFEYMAVKLEADNARLNVRTGVGH